MSRAALGRKLPRGRRNGEGHGNDEGVHAGYELEDRADRAGPGCRRYRKRRREAAAAALGRCAREKSGPLLGRCAAVGPRGNGARGGEDWACALAWAEASADRREKGVGLRARLGCGKKKRSRPSGIIRERENFSFLFYFQNQFKCKPNQF